MGRNDLTIIRPVSTEILSQLHAVTTGYVWQYLLDECQRQAGACESRALSFLRNGECTQARIEVANAALWRDVPRVLSGAAKSHMKGVAREEKADAASDT